MINQFQKSFVASVIAATLFVTQGCGSSEKELPRRVVEGTITFDNVPIEYGTIRFTPEPAGPIASAIIQNGKYRCENKGGVPVGPVKVEIEASPNTASMSEDELLAKGAPKAVEIPEKYNTKSELKSSIESGKDVLTLNYELKK